MCSTSHVFTSPVRDEPSAVVVNYHFLFDNGTDTVDTWFWAQSGAYILHPLFIFQFITLFFGNPKPIYEQVVHVTLNGTKCYGVHNNSDYMMLLTQRVSLISSYMHVSINYCDHHYYTEPCI